ncbi:hypothetical protein GCM10009799_12130 [Nocardiopsis rhodophaea]|uniref:Uncharacterized protein n=1 Tax=Nocardiopsis rhodophaea TaxID=280238 RepID=A0ABN2SK67_9ACTN
MERLSQARVYGARALIPDSGNGGKAPVSRGTRTKHPVIPQNGRCRAAGPAPDRVGWRRRKTS